MITISNIPILQQKDEKKKSYSKINKDVSKYGNTKEIILKNLT